ncbi:MAG: MFS transporter, partial [Phyllobacteriaceae bacterium]|nr:MFS transporter [Phyllobacteriaceae bacterium]
RRKPDAKWKLTEKTLALRVKEQRDVLTRAASLVKKGGRIAYYTCSLLPEENTEQVAWFLADHKDYKIVPYTEQWAKTIGGVAPHSADGSRDTLLLTPRRHGTDGFFVAVMQRV